MSTLDDLERAIEAVPPIEEGTKAYVYQSRRADAWRTYARFLENWVPCIGSPCTCAANEAHQLVKDKLS